MRNRMNAKLQRIVRLNNVLERACKDLNDAVAEELPPGTVIKAPPGDASL